MPRYNILVEVFFLIILTSVTSFADEAAQDDTVNVQHAELLPIIDGLGNDE
jgi:hypothetical protein